MGEHPEGPPGQEGDDIERVLVEGLRSEPLGQAAMQRLRDAALQEWQLGVREGHRRSGLVRYRLWAAAAAVACVAVGLVWFLGLGSTPETFGAIVRMDAAGGEIRGGLLYHRAVKVGSTLHGGDVLTSHGPILVTLAAGGTLRVAPDSILRLTAATALTLQRGRIYLDFPPGGRSGSLGVGTWAGTIEHVGTEYEVLSNEQIVRIRVREGRVLLQGEATQTMLDAGTQLTASRDGGLTRTGIEPYGRDWLWVTELAPDYEIEGRPLLDFLQWIARELGRPLKFSDPHAREVAERTILHGSVKGQEPLEALAKVLSTTSLSYEIRGDTIWVQSGRGA